MKPALIADTGGLLRALARRPDGLPSFPDFTTELREAVRVVVPGLVLAEVDCFLRAERAAMRALVADVFDPASRYEFEPALPDDIARTLYLDARFAEPQLGLVDGCVAAVADRRKTFRVLTTDRRDFGALRVGPHLDRPLDLVP